MPSLLSSGRLRRTQPRQNQASNNNAADDDISDDDQHDNDATAAKRRERQAEERTYEGEEDEVAEMAEEGENLLEDPGK